MATTNDNYDNRAPIIDDCPVPLHNRFELERLTTLKERYAKRYIRFIIMVTAILCPLAGTMTCWMSGALQLYTKVGTAPPDFPTWLYFAPQVILMVGCLLFCLYLHYTLVRPGEYVIEMRRTAAGFATEFNFVDDDRQDDDVAPLNTALVQDSLLSEWEPAVTHRQFIGGNYVSDELPASKERDRIVERSKLGKSLFKIGDRPTDVFYEPIRFVLDDALPRELMIPKIHQVGIDSQLRLTRINQAANSVDMSSTENEGRKDALIAARTAFGATDPWSMTVASVAADVQSRSQVPDAIADFLLAQ